MVTATCSLLFITAKLLLFRLGIICEYFLLTFDSVIIKCAGAHVTN